MGLKQVQSDGSGSVDHEQCRKCAVPVGQGSCPVDRKSTQDQRTTDD
jgi:hypothetical protein